MLSIKSESFVRTKNWTTDSIYILADFDRTLTSCTSNTSWSILSKSDIMCEEYCKERSALYDYYRPLEIDPALDYTTKNKLMIEWWNKHINLLIKYKLSESTIKEASKNVKVLKFRKGAKKFLETMKSKNIPVIIISAGIGNFIKDFLIANNCDFDNIYIISNFIEFKNSIAIGISDNIIHSLNKSEVSLPDDIKMLINNRPNIVLLGDSLSDVRMAKESARKNALKIGFLDENIEENKSFFEEAFDIVATDNTGFDSIMNILSIFDN